MKKKHATPVRIFAAMSVVLLNITSTDAQVPDRAVISTAEIITCPPGKHAYANGFSTTCKWCPKGFFSASESSSNIDSCIAHTKCPPGKYTHAAGTTIKQPKCNTCAPGFFKSWTSISSTCGKSDYYRSKHCRTTHALLEACSGYEPHLSLLESIIQVLALHLSIFSKASLPTYDFRKIVEYDSSH